jgi:hypothetical protein
VRPLVFIAAPYSKPDPVVNTRIAIKAGMAIYEHEHALPLIPHLSMLAHLVEPRPVDWWYEFDLLLLARCDALWRLPGESTGADREVREARLLGLPVFLDGQALVKWLRERAA